MASSRDMDTGALQAALSGDHAAFAPLVDRYFGLVYAIGYARLLDRAAAEDLAQEVFLRAYLHRANVDAARLPAWLSRVTRNLACDWLRERRRRSQILKLLPIDELPEPPASTAPEPPAQAAREEQHAMLDDAIRSLPVEMRELVLLHHAEQLPNDEIALRLGVHPSTVGRQLRQAFRLMRGRLEPEWREAAYRLQASRACVGRVLGGIALVAGLSNSARAALLEATADSVGLAVANLVSTATSPASAFSTITHGIKGATTMAGVKVAAGLIVLGGIAAGSAYLRPTPPLPAANSTPSPAGAVQPVRPEPAAPPEVAPGQAPERASEPPPVTPKETPSPAPLPAAAAEMPAPATSDKPDFSSPQATVATLTKAVGSGNWDLAIRCFLPGGTDYEDIQEIARAAAGSRAARIKAAMECWDAAAPAEVTSVAETSGGTKVVWLVTLKCGYSAEGVEFVAGQKQEFDATLVKSENGEWLVENF